jgi:hypothetical protein
VDPSSVCCAVVVLGAPLWALIGLNVGKRKGQAATGCLLGLVAGPLGVLLIAIAEGDGRRPCPKCDERISRKAAVCPHCRSEIRPG